MKTAVASKIITYSPSATVALTHACANRCLYCGFRKDGTGLMRFGEIERIARQALWKKTPEILLMSGERADSLPSVRGQLAELGLDSIVAWTKQVASYLLDSGLLPHINIGLLDYDGLKELSKVSASMGLMMEGDYGRLGARVQPQKHFAKRMQNLAWAGELKIPFTTGILMGLGESQSDRLRSVQAIIDCARDYNHVQEIILQDYVPNNGSCLMPHAVSAEELGEIVDLVKGKAPDITLQVPPNLNSDWANLLSRGFDDIGGIGNDGVDSVNPGSLWPSVNDISRLLSGKGYQLRKRLPIYPKYYKLGWYSPEVGAVIEKWLRSEDEYRYYIE